jgi:hypothetical protein
LSALQKILSAKPIYYINTAPNYIKYEPINYINKAPNCPSYYIFLLLDLANIKSLVYRWVVKSLWAGMQLPLKNLHVPLYYIMKKKKHKSIFEPKLHITHVLSVRVMKNAQDFLFILSLKQSNPHQKPTTKKKKKGK